MTFGIKKLFGLLFMVALFTLLTVSPADSPAADYCETHDNCILMPD